MELTEGDSSELQSLLIDDKIELAIMLRPGSEREAQAFAMTKLPVQELMVCTSRQHRFRRKNSLELTELAGENIIAYGDTLYQQYLNGAAPLPAPLLSSTHLSTILQLTADDYGLAILPENLATRREDIVSIPLEPAVFIQPVIAQKSGRHLSHAAEALLSIIQGGAKHA